MKKLSFYVKNNRYYRKFLARRLQKWLFKFRSSPAELSNLSTMREISETLRRIQRTLHQNGRTLDKFNRSRLTHYVSEHHVFIEDLPHHINGYYESIVTVGQTKFGVLNVMDVQIFPSGITPNYYDVVAKLELIIHHSLNDFKEETSAPDGEVEDWKEI